MSTPATPPHSPSSLDAPNSAEPGELQATRAWVDRAVIGLNLCPFAKAVQVKGQVRYVLSEAQDDESLLQTLVAELEHLAEVDPAITDTTLIVHPQAMQDFLDFNDFLEVADAALEHMGLEGVLQIASFHPQFQFDGTDIDDVSNATNRSPYPTLHLIREDSIERAVAAFPEPEAIFEANIETLEKLGIDGWTALMAQCQADVKRH
jgi:hypothetical protein